MQYIVHRQMLTFAKVIMCGMQLGCTQTLRFKVVDSESHQPLFASTVVDAEHLAYFSYVDEIRYGGNTDKKGLITLQARTNSDWQTSIEFYEPGYFDAGYSIIDRREDYVRGVSMTENKNGMIEMPAYKDKDGFIVINMTPAPPGTKDLALQNWVMRPTAGGFRVKIWDR